jgi:GxxExxY protein
MQYKHSDVTGKILKAFYTVYNGLGYGFLEKVYENAMAIELRGMELRAIQQAPIVVRYANQIVGEYSADLLVEDKVIVEMKASRTIADAHEAQLLNYLKATEYEVGLLLNFGPTPDKRRRIYDNGLKQSHQCRSV